MSRAILILNTAAARATAIRWIGASPDGTILELKQSKRSTEQNALMWARLTEIARRVDWYGAKLTADDWKDVFSASLRKARVVPGIDPGTYVPLGMRTSDMTKAEMTALLDLIDAFAAERGIEFHEVRADAA